MERVTLVEHRLRVLEEASADHDGRIRALEIGYARLVGWAAGGAFVGGLVFQLLSALWGK